MADFGEEPRLPAIPDLGTGNVAAAVAAIKEWVEVRQGARGDKLDRAVTMRDLLNAGLATPEAINGLFPGSEPIPLIPGADSPAIPPTPTDLLAAGAVTSIILSWQFAPGYTRLAYFEVWRSETDAIGDALKIAQTEATIYADEVGSSARYYYWVRAVSDAGQSPFNALEGTLGETALSVEEVLDAITDEINDSGLLDQLTIKVNNDGRVSGYGLASTPSDSGTSTAFAILANRFLVAAPASTGLIPAPAFVVQATPTIINGVSVPAGVYMDSAYIMNGVITNAKIGNLAVDNAKIASVSVAKLIAGSMSVSAFIESASYSSGVSGFRINGNGTAEFNNVTVRGTVVATAGSIGGNTINSTGMQSPNYNGTNGWRINSDGSVFFGSGTFRGSITGASGTFAGNLHGGQFTTGAFTGYAWPAAPGIGSYLGPDGLLLGNANNGKYLQVTSTGDIYTPGFSIVGGAMNLLQANIVKTLNVASNAITGNITAEGGSGAIGAGSAATLVSAAITMPAGASGVSATMNVNIAGISGNATMYITLLRNGTPVRTIGVSVTSGFVQTFTVPAFDNPGAGTHTYSMYVANATSGPGSFQSTEYTGPFLLLAGAKR